MKKNKMSSEKIEPKQFIEKLHKDMVEYEKLREAAELQLLGWKVTQELFETRPSKPNQIDVTDKINVQRFIKAMELSIIIKKALTNFKLKHEIYSSLVKKAGEIIQRFSELSTSGQGVLKLGKSREIDNRSAEEEWYAEEDYYLEWLNMLYDDCNELYDEMLEDWYANEFRYEEMFEAMDEWELEYEGGYGEIVEYMFHEYLLSGHWGGGS